VDVRAALIADGEATESMKPGQRPLHDPPVSPQLLLRLDAAPRDPRSDASGATSPSTAREVVALVGMKLRRPLPRRSAPATHGPHTVEQVLESLGVVLVRGAELNGEGDALRGYQHMMLRARLPAIRRIRASFVAPLLAGTLEASSAVSLVRFAAHRPA
jgi:hypothetical protein